MKTAKKGLFFWLSYFFSSNNISVLLFELQFSGLKSFLGLPTFAESKKMASILEINFSSPFLKKMGKNPSWIPFFLFFIHLCYYLLSL